MARWKDCATTDIRNFSESAIRRFYGDVGYRTDSSEFHLNMGVANNNFGAAAAVPVELLQNYWGATYTTPQTTANRVAYVNLTGKVEVTPTWTIEGSARVRAFRQKTVDGNPTETEPCAADPGAALLQRRRPRRQTALTESSSQIRSPPTPCWGRSTGQRPVRRRRGRPCRQPTPTSCSDTTTSSWSAPVSIPASPASGPARNWARSVQITSSAAAAYFSGRPASPISIGPVSLRATNRYTGLYALDTFDVTDAFSISGGGRFNYASIVLQDQIGTDLNGNHTFSRFNPMIGGTYKITPELTAYAGYSEANRAPTPLELACADPARPCIVAAFLIADPPLKQVVSRTVEAGFRGTKELNIGTLGWKVGAFRATNADDILAIPSPEVQGFGYFQNVGRTRRQGIEAQVNLTSKTLQLYASYALVDARFLDALQLNSRQPVRRCRRQYPGPAGQPNSGDSPQPGQVRHRLLGHRRLQGRRRCAVRQPASILSATNPTRRRGCPAYSVFNLHASYQINKTFQIYGRVDNIFDNRYATYGTFFETDDVPNFANGGAEFTDPRSVSPARPRAFYAGLKATF